MATTEADKQALMGLEFNYSLGETSGGIALIVLAILALAKIDPMLLNAIAVIVAGIALLVEDRSMRARQAGLMSYTAAYSPETAAISGGVSAGTLAGITGIVLGILAILGIAAVVLTSVALIVFGAAVLFDFAAGAQAMVVRPIYREGAEQSVRVMRTAAPAWNSSAMLIAVALVTLGILALAGLVSSILVTVGLLGLGAYLFIQNAAIAGSLFGMTA